MKKRILVVIFLTVALLITVGGVLSQGPAAEDGIFSTWGETLSGFGSHGTRWINLSGSGIAYGVRGESYSTSGRGVLGWARSSSGSSYGVWGFSDSANGLGVVGQVGGTTGINYGLYGQTPSTSGRGVLGYATAASGNTIGVWGYSSSSTGTGVYANGIRYGTQAYASSTAGDAVFARATATSGPAWAINAYTASPSGWSGVFQSAGNGIYVGTPSGNVGLTVVGGTKNAAVETGGESRLFYTEESTEVWFTDYGFGKLENGQAVVNIDSLYGDTVNLDQAYHVFVQAYGDSELYVSERTPAYFVVRAMSGSRGLADVEFSYRIVAKRSGYEDARLELSPWSTSEGLAITAGKDLTGGTDMQLDTELQQLRLDNPPLE